MKKSRIAKFALLGASAAALAATLSTSTYAWYVSNIKLPTLMEDPVQLALLVLMDQF